MGLGRFANLPATHSLGGRNLESPWRGGGKGQHITTYFLDKDTAPDLISTNMKAFVFFVIAPTLPSPEYLLHLLELPDLVGCYWDLPPLIL